MNFKINLSKIKKNNKKLNLAITKKINISKISNQSISKRDFILISLLLLAVEGYILINFLLIPKWQQFITVYTQYNSQKALATSLEKDNAKSGQFQEQLKLLDYKQEKLKKELPSNVAQEEIMITLNKLATERKLKINSIAFSEISSVSKDAYISGKIPSGQTQDAAKGNTPAKATNNSKTIPKTSGGMVLTEDISIAFSGDYGALYNFISDLEKSTRKIITKEIIMTKGNGNTLKGELKVQYVGYKGQDDTGIFKLETPQLSGKSNPFLAYEGYNDNGTVASSSQAESTVAPAPVKVYEPNFYLILNTIDDNAPKVIMGDYTKTGTELYGNANDKVRGKISISGNMDKMHYSYSIGSSTQTKEARLAIDGGKLRMDVISQQRKNTTDKVGIILDVDNKTDYPLEINVTNDDKNAPRFSIGNKSGSVVVK